MRVLAVLAALALCTSCAHRKPKVVIPTAPPRCDYDSIYPGAQDYVDSQLENCDLHTTVKS